MAKWWLGLPLIALGWANSASAQAPPPYGPMAPLPMAPAGNAPMPQMPPPGYPGLAPGQQMLPPGYPGLATGPGAVPPGALPPTIQPPGLPATPMPTLDPGPPFSLPGDDDLQGNAFSEGQGDAKKEPEGCVYFSTGFMGLMRQGLGHGVIASLDPGNGIDTGINPPPTAPTLLRFSDVSPDFNWGTKATIGYRCGCDAIEFTGYYLGLTTAAHEIADPGKIDLPFSAAAFPSPLGFQGDNFLWLQADYVKIVQETRVANAEFNYRYSYAPGLELIAGVRYMDVQEHFSIATDDDGIVLSQFGLPPDPFAQAIYTITTHNRIVAPQLGLAWECPLVSWLSISSEAKGAWGANFMSEDHLLLRGDGFLGPSSHIATTLFSQIYDVGLFANVTLGEHIRVKAGYQALWVVDVPVASNLVDFNPNDAKARQDYHGSIFFHGPSVEIMFSF
jgi:hypothetical protein